MFNLKNPYPEDDVEAKDDILEAAGDLAGVPDPPPPLCILWVCRGHPAPPKPVSPMCHFFLQKCELDIFLLDN